VRTTDLNNGILNNTEIKITQKACSDYNLSILPRTTVCVAMYGGAGTIGKHCILDFDTTINQSVCAIQPNGFCNMDYIHTFIEFQRPYWMEFAAGSRKDPNINQIIIKHCLLPIPPIKEQYRIILKINQLYPYISQFENCNNELSQLNKDLWHILKKSILRDAIQGKLVPQIESEGTAQELLEQIQQEKLKLVKEGTLKKSTLSSSVIFKGDDNKYYEKVGKDVVDITEEIPFEIPSTWCWCRGKTIFLPMQSTKPASDFIYIDVDAVNNKTNTIDNPKNIQLKAVPSRATRKLECNNVLFSMVRPYLRNIAIVNEQYSNAIASTGFYVIRPTVALYPQYLFRLMLSSYVVDGLNKFMKGENSPSINNNHIEDYLYPLPPINEQKRIIEQLDLLFQQLR
jgi:type I restriction enzyme S subunit